MTSQHFENDGWDNWDEWGGAGGGNPNEANNNNKAQSSQSHFVPQQQQHLPHSSLTTAAAPVYSPFAYTQPTVPVPQQQQPPPILQQTPQQQPLSSSQVHHQPQSQPYTNPVNFFNASPSAHFNDTTNNNNPLSAFNSVQSPIQTPMTTIQQQPASTSSQFNPPSNVNPYSNFQSEGMQTKTREFVPYETTPGLQQHQKASFTPPPPLSTANNAPPPATSSFYNPSQQDIKNMNFVQQQQHPPVSYHQQQVATTNYQEQTQFNQWNDQTHQQQQQQQQFMNWQTQAAFNHPQQQQPPVSSNSSNDWERISPDSIQFLQQQTQQQQANNSGGVSEVFSQPPRKEEILQTQIKSEEIQPTIFSPTIATSFQQMSPTKVENVENIQSPAAELPMTSYNSNSSFMQPTVDVYPENRERLDEVTPLRPPSSSSSIDRHNYLVTGQLSNEIQQFNQNSLTESFPPPGLSRMVVGEPESNQENVPSGHRMVTGTEMTPASYLNYQRQADGEVSQAPSMVPPVRPPSHPQSFIQPHHNVEHEQLEQQQNFNVGDRNLYLVAGESDLNSQRVIPGVESDNNNVINNVSSVINPLQNLHIEDDDDFVNISVSSQHRNVDGDGMEEQNPPQRQIANASEQREEDIEGANDNNLENAAISMPIVASNDPEIDVREDIEGANDPLPAVKSSDISEPRKSFDKKLKPESSEDSELREVERKAKPRRSKKYNSNYSDSENDDDEYKERNKRDKYDDRYKKSSTRERAMTRDEYEKHRRREKERRSGGGSRYYESTRRTDDDEDVGRRIKKSGRDSRGGEGEDEGLENRERRKNDKKKDGKRNYDDKVRRTRHGRTPDFYGEDYSTRGRPKNPYENAYYQGYGGGYDPNMIYQQQQYFEMLRRTNPQYYEYYKNYYSMMQQQQQMQASSGMHNPPSVGPMDDIGGSLRSGYSSSNERDRASTSRFLPGGNVSNPLRSLNTSFIDSTDYNSLQASTSFQPIGKDPYTSLNYNQSYGYDGYNDLRQKQEAINPGRMTPKKFQCPHDYLKLSNGLMVTIDTLNNDDRFLVKLENVPIYDRTRRLYQTYPGPLVRGVSHKKTVIEFCEERLRQNSHIDENLRSSYALLWSYLILMLRQNGTYTEADISELLMKNSEDFSLHEPSIVENNEEADDNTDVSDSEENTTSEKNSNTASRATNSQTVSQLTEKNVLDKFKNYLLYGNISDALDFATDNNLWGHALFLASKVDRRQHANVMLKFANKLPYNDPLQTLYQIMSGRMPSCVSNLDDKWGDWRPHLAMIISNCTDKPDLVKRSVIALGDSLASRGDIFGSQFCYLLMDPQFTDFSDSTMSNGKIGLLGVSLQQKNIREFATDDAIIMTEVYEYARSLSVENYFIASLQKYKFLLATNLLDYSMQLKCLLYMEQISKCIAQRPDLFDTAFMARIYSFGDRLKFYDPVLERAYEDGQEEAEDQKWLQDLYGIMESYGGVQQMPQVIPTYSNNDVYNPMDYQQQQQQQQTPASGIYDPMSQHQTPTHVPLMQSQQQQQQPVYEEVEQTYDQQNNSNQMYNQDYNQYQQQQPPPPTVDYGYGQNASIRRESQPQAEQQQQNFMQPQANTYDPNNQMNYQPDYGYSGYDQNYQQAAPKITMGNSASKNYEDTRENDSEQKKNESPQKMPQKAEIPKKTPQDPNANSGWFGGIFSKLKSKSSQMKLPDDKNPSIVWDEKLKQWVNKDEDPAEAESFKPPPKMGEMKIPAMQTQPMMQQQQQQQHQNSIPPSSSAIPTMQSNQFAQQQQFTAAPSMPENPYGVQAPQQTAVNSMPMPTQQYQQQQQQQQQPIADQPAPPSAPNMFKMQKGRNLKKSYVDILGNSGQTIPATSDVAPPPQMDMQFFNPQAQQPQGMQFYNPNDFQ